MSLAVTYSWPGSSVHGILWAILEWVAILYSRDLPNPRTEPLSLILAGRFSNHLSNQASQDTITILQLGLWRRQWQPTPVLLPGKSHGRRSLEGCSPWGRWGSYTTERLHFHALEKEMATHSNILAWRIPGTGEPGGLWGRRVGHNWSDLAAASLALWVSQVVLVRNPSANADETCRFNPCAGRSPGEGNGNPLQSFSLENPMDRAWWGTVHRVTKSAWINLAQLSFSELTFPYKQGPHSQWSPGNSASLPVRYCTRPTDCFPLKDSCH